MQGDVVGPSQGPWTIEQAVLALLSTPPEGSTYPLIVYYLADQERELGLEPQTLPVPPGPSSYAGGVDAMTFRAGWFPMMHVNVQPTGSAKKLDMNTYAQVWQVTVTCTAGDDDENTARMVADSYATAIALLVAQNGALGIGAMNTTIDRMPAAQLLDPVQSRQVCRSVVAFNTTTAPVLTTTGPTAWPDDPYTTPGSWPEVSTVNVTVDAVPAS